VPAGSNGLLAIFSNVMDVKRWVQAVPSFVGFDVDDPTRTDRRACIRAVEEQAAFATRGHLAILEELTGSRFTEVAFAGGGAKGTLWPRIVADVLGVTVRVPAVKESTALGAALFAGLGVGLYDDLDRVTRDIVRVERTIDPDPVAHETYDAAYARWSAVYPRILGLAEDRLAAPMWWPAGADATAHIT
jgi:autoinducer 2 (AI-2) kinase